jgi:hypothetical protein
MLIVVIGFYGCNFKVYSNGKKTGSVKPVYKNWKSSNDSCLVYHIFDSLPKSLLYINSIIIKSPFVWNNPASPNNVMAEVAKTEAGKIGANVIQVVDYGSAKFSKYTFSVRTYYLSDSMWAVLKNTLDKNENARTKANEKFCIVHVKCFDNVGGPLYFNDSLVGGFQVGARKREKLFPNRIKRLDFRFPYGGILSPGKLSELNYRIKGKRLLKGQEYYYELDISKFGNYLRRVDIDDYF